MNREQKRIERRAKKLYLALFEIMADELHIARGSLQLTISKLEQSNMFQSAEAIRQILKVVS